MDAETAGRIERVDIFGYDLTYVHGDYVMSSGRVVNRLASTIVRVTTRNGTTGFGEVCPLGAIAAGTPADALFAFSFMNDWTNEHVAGYQPRSSGGVGRVPEGPGSASTSRSQLWALRSGRPPRERAARHEALPDLAARRSPCAREPSSNRGVATANRGVLAPRRRAGPTDRVRAG